MSSFITSEEIEYVITEDGLSSISNNGDVIATGGIYLWDSALFHNLEILPTSFYPLSLARSKENYTNQNFYTKVAGTVKNREITNETISTITVEHQHTNNVTATYTYSFDNPDLTIEVDIKNNSKKNHIVCPTIGGLFFDFSEDPSGVFYDLDQDDTDKLHPSPNVPTYGSYIYETSYGVGITSSGVKEIPSLVNMDFRDSGELQKERHRVFEYHNYKIIEPLGRYKFTIILRVSTNTDYTNLLEPYKTDLLSTYNTLQYEINNRKWIAGVEASDVYGAVDSSNPYGFKSTHRFDDSDSTTSYIEDLIELLGTTSRGPVFYDLHGWPYDWYNVQPLTSNISSAFDSWPILVEDNYLDIIRPGLIDDYELGIISELKYFNVRRTMTTNSLDVAIKAQSSDNDLATNTSNNWNIVLRRVAKLADYGTTIFYCPNSGDSLECYHLAKQMREYLGDSISILFGKYCDIMAPFVGFHTVTSYDVDYETTMPTMFLEVMKWVFDDIECYTEKGGGIVDDAEFYEHIFTEKLSFWATDESEMAEVASYQAAYIDSGTGQFYDDDTTVTSILGITTDASVTPTTEHFTLPGDVNAIRLFTDVQSIAEPSFYTYVRVNGGTAKKILLHRHTGRILSASPGDTLSIGTSDGRTLNICGMTTPAVLETISGATGTANCDAAGPPLWEPTAPHITLASFNSAFILESDGTEKVIFISEYDGAAWTPARFVRLPASTDIKVRCTYKQIALANYAGATVDITAPTGAVIGGTSGDMTFGITATGTTRTVTADDESDFRTKMSEAISGDEIVLPAGTYTLTAAISASTFAANSSKGNGIIIRGATGTRSDVIIQLNSGSSQFAINNTSTTEPMLFKDLTIDVSTSTTGVDFGAGVFRFENVHVFGPTSGVNPLFSIRTQTTGPIDCKVLNCLIEDSAEDCFNGSGVSGGTHETTSIVQLIASTFRESGNTNANQQCITTHFNLPLQLYGCTISDAHTNALANDSNTNSISYLFFTDISNGTRNSAAQNCNYFFATATTNSSASTESYNVSPVATSPYQIGFKVTTSGGSFGPLIQFNGTRYLGIVEACQWIGSGSPFRCTKIDNGGSEFRFNVITGFTGEGLYMGTYDSSGHTTAVPLKNNTMSGVGTAISLTSSTVACVLTNNATRASTTGVNITAAQMANLTTSYNVIDPTIDADFTAGSNDVVSGDAAVSTTTFFPTASGNCDVTGTSTAFDWVGGIDIWGFVARHKSTNASIGARELPVIYSGAELFPDYWI